jgi:hypothetical protein
MIPIDFSDRPSRERISDPGVAKPVLGPLDGTVASESITPHDGCALVSKRYAQKLWLC